MEPRGWVLFQGGAATGDRAHSTVDLAWDGYVGVCGGALGGRAEYGCSGHTPSSSGPGPSLPSPPAPGSPQSCSISSGSSNFTRAKAPEEVEK